METQAARTAVDGRQDRMVAIGASAGGFEPLCAVLGSLGKDFQDPILVVQHLAPNHVSHLVELLASRTTLPVEEARDGQRPLPGHVYVAPPNRHMGVEHGQLRLTQAPLVHFTRPSVDVLFDSVARSFADRAIAVVLSGSGTDGTDGARAIRAGGGRVVVQDEESSANYGMPGSVVAAGAADAVLAPREIAAYLETESRGE